MYVNKHAIGRSVVVVAVVVLILIAVVAGYIALNPGSSSITSTKSLSSSLTPSTSSSALSVISSTSASTTSAVSSAPSQILIGSVYASTGSLASLSVPVHEGLQLWADQVNKQGGIYVSSFQKNIPVKLVSYDDQSSASSAGTFYNQLVTVDHVNLLVCDASSFLSAPAVPITQANHVLLVTPFAFATSLYNGTNPYNVGIYPLVSPSEAYNIPQLLSLNIANPRIALIYAQQSSNTAQDNDMVSRLAAAGITPVLNRGLAAGTTDFSSIVAQLQSLKLDVVYIMATDIMEVNLLNALGNANVHINYTFSTFAGVEVPTFVSQVGKNLRYVFSWGFPPLVKNLVNYGPTFAQFSQIWSSAYPNEPVGTYGIIGYSTGLVVQKAIETAGSLDSLTMRNAMNQISGKTTTVWGPFIIDPKSGAQIFAVPLVQFLPDSTGVLQPQVVYPRNISTAQPVYPQPLR